MCGPHRTIHPQGQGQSQIDFMCVTMIDPATSWFEIVELLVSQLQKLDIPMGTKGQRSKDTHVQEQHPTLTRHQQQ